MHIEITQQCQSASSRYCDICRSALEEAQNNSAIPAKSGIQSNVIHLFSYSYLAQVFAGVTKSIHARFLDFAGRAAFPKSPILDCMLLTAAIVLSRWLFRSHYLYLMDSVNFALGLTDFSPQLHQPHPPGYFLYILVGRLAQHLLPDANDALVAISIVASATTASLVYALTHAWFGRKAARFAGILFLFSPLAWFHGTVALIYMMEACLAALVGLLCWHACNGRPHMVVAAAVALGLAAGFRQSTTLFLAPMWLLALWKARWCNALFALPVFAITIAAWFIPMLTASGGAEHYFTPLHDLWEWAPAAQSAVSSFTGFAWLVLTRGMLLTVAFGLCFGFALPLLFASGLPIPFIPGLKIFLAAWLLPGTIFFAALFFHPIALGYALFLAVPLFAVLGAKAAVWHTEVTVPNQIKVAIVAAAAAANIGMFLFTPLYSSYQNINHYGRELASLQQNVRSGFDPKSTLIVTLDAHVGGFRHAGYYLPEYFVVQYPEMKFTEGTRVFAMSARKTQLLERLPLERFDRFVVLGPFGDKEAAKEFRASLIKSFPAGALSTTSIEEHDYLTGPTAYLGRLFPRTTRSGASR